MQVTELLCDLLFRQVGCTPSQPDISPGGSLPFLTVMHLNSFSISPMQPKLVQLLNIRHLPYLGAQRSKLGDGRKILEDEEVI